MKSKIKKIATTTKFFHIKVFRTVIENLVYTFIFLLTLTYILKMMTELQKYNNKSNRECQIKKNIYKDTQRIATNG